MPAGAINLSIHRQQVHSLVYHLDGTDTILPSIFCGIFIFPEINLTVQTAKSKNKISPHKTKKLFRTEIF